MHEKVFLSPKLTWKVWDSNPTPQKAIFQVKKRDFQVQFSHRAQRSTKIISVCKVSLEPLVLTEKGLIFTKFYAKGLEALKVWAKLLKKQKGSSGIRTHNLTKTPQSLQLYQLSY